MNRAIPSMNYEKVPSHDSELDSDEGERIDSTENGNWPDASLQRRPRSVLSVLWQTVRAVFVLISVCAWVSSLWLVWLTTRELGQARSIIQHPPTVECSNTPAPKVSPSSTPQHESSKVPFIEGGTLPVPGYGLVYNTSYCNGWDDPDGARSRGCVLDASQGGWVHELCHDKYLLKEWLSLPDFGWWSFPNRTGQIAQEDVWAANVPGGVMTPLYTVNDFHVQHCKFVMRLRTKNGMRKHRGLGYIPLDPAHMNHCLEMMTEITTPESKHQLTQVVLGNFGGGTEGFGLAGECYMPVS